MWVFRSAFINMLHVIETDGVWTATCSNCEWSSTKTQAVPILHRCPVTGLLHKYKPPDWQAVPRVNPHIDVMPLKPVSRVRKIVNFMPALAKHIKTGRKEVSDEVVAANWEICQACELFLRHTEVNGECTHPSCGCTLRAVGQTGRNKLRWADQSCPIGKWTNLDKERK